MVTKVKISKALHDIFREKASPSTQSEAHVFLIGSKDGKVATDFVEVHGDNHHGFVGCAWMPYIYGSDLTRAYLELVKKKLTFISFVRVDGYPVERTSTQWGGHGSEGHAPRDFAGVPIVTYRPNQSYANIYYDGDVSISVIPLSVIEPTNKVIS